MAAILIIDDEECIRAFVSAVFGDKHAIYEASDGFEGEHLAARYQPDLIITDLNMPKRCGLEMIRNIRTRDHGVKILAFSADLNCPRECERVLHAGANRCLAKPGSIAALEQAVGALLAKHHTAAAHV